MPVNQAPWVIAQVAADEAVNKATQVVAPRVAEDSGNQAAGVAARRVAGTLLTRQLEAC